MGYQSIQLKLPTSYSDQELKQAIAHQLRISDFTFQIENKSLDARKRSDIHWLLKVGVHSDQIQGSEENKRPGLQIEYKRRNKKVIVTGSGPAGFFAAYVLQKAGFETILIERGADVEKRAKGIDHFETSGIFDPLSNYSFGEGGAGTFSDGKLTSRSKHISDEREFVLQTYAEAGAPQEILYMAHPHVGSDNLKVVVSNLRKTYKLAGGKIIFETMVEDMTVKSGHVTEAKSRSEIYPGDYFIFAPGHSSYETYRMLMNRGVAFRTKNFAIGSRAEHQQKEINRGQWGVPSLAGVKAAEYRLTSQADGKHPVYSFCMCPGGKVVPAASYGHVNLVNGMSDYLRNGQFSNAGCVAGIHPDELAGRKLTPLEALQIVEDLEHSFYQFSGGFIAPFCSIKDFLSGKDPKSIPSTSYPLGLKPARLWEMLPKPVVQSMREGLKDFNRQLRGYENGILLGLESKTSSPIQVLREPNGLCTGFENLFICGEGSGYTGGIISSAADGMKTAVKIIEKEH